jgi:hypothetical protein
MAEGVVKLLETRPTKLEVLDRSFIDVAAKSDPKLGEGIPDSAAIHADCRVLGRLAETTRALPWTRRSKLLRRARPGLRRRAGLRRRGLEKAWTVRKVASPILAREGRLQADTLD